MSRIIETVLRQFDNEERELILRFRLCRSDWFPYRTAELIFPESDDEATWEAWEFEHGPWKWHPPRKLKRFFSWIQLRSRFLIP